MKHRTLVLLAASIMAPTAAIGSQQLATPRYTKILELDSTTVWGPALSPDGRWIAYSASRLGQPGRNLWVIPAAGGSPMRLTSGDFDDAVPMWFPTSDKIVFRSSRASGALMTMRIDPATGRETEAPRRISIDVPSSQYAVSPDGKWVVYTNTETATQPGIMRMVPASGGQARTLDSAAIGAGGFHSPDFTPDGRFVEYLWHAGPEVTQERALRVSVSGGKPTVLHGPVGHWTRFENGVIANTPQGADTIWLQNTRGDTIGRFALENLSISNPYRFVRFTSQPGSFLAVTGRGSTQTHVIPATGGTPRVVGPVGGYILGFTTDGDVIIAVSGPGRRSVEIHPLGGTAPRRYVLPESARLVDMTNDASTLYWRKDATLGAMNVATGASRVVSRSFVKWGDSYIADNTVAEGARYVERRNGRFELRRWWPAGDSSRVMRSINATNGTAVSEYVGRGDIEAYSLATRDSIIIYVARGTAAPVRIFGTRGGHTDGLSISQDGRRLAFAVQLARSGGGVDSHVIGFADIGDGAGSRAPTIVAAPPMTALAWLPGTNDVVYLEMGATRTDVMRVSATEGARPRKLTEAERSTFWELFVSADGKWIGYPADLPPRSAIWRVDIPGLESRLVSRP